jgi:hypothetical protein
MTIAAQLESYQGAMKLSRFAEVMGVCYMTAYRWAAVFRASGHKK